MKNFIKTVLAASLMLAGMSLQAVTPETIAKLEQDRSVKLLLGDQEFFVPKDVVKQAKTIAHNMDEFGDDNIQVGEQVTPAAMDKIKQIMWVIHENSNLTGKDLLDEIEKKVSTPDAIAFDLLRGANYLDFQPAIDFAARTLAKSRILRNLKVEAADIQGKEILPLEMLQKIVWYWNLIPYDELQNIEGSRLGVHLRDIHNYTPSYSIQDYLDYNPHDITRRRHIAISNETGEVLADELKLGHFGMFKLSSLEGLQNIPDINTVKLLSLEKHNLKEIDPTILRNLPQLESLYLEGNELTDENKQQIREALPRNVKVWFGGLWDLSNLRDDEEELPVEEEVIEQGQ